MPCGKAVFIDARPGTRTWCRGCARSIGMHLWKCPCGIPWRECPSHRASPQIAPSDPAERPPLRPRTGSKRDQSLVEGEGPSRSIQRRLDAPPQRPCTASGSAEPMVSLGYSQCTLVAKPNLWTPRLRQRFGKDEHRPDSGHDVLPNPTCPIDSSRRGS